MPQGDLTVVTSYFNPEHYRNRLANYKLFRDKLRYQDVPCLTVECVLEGDFPELEPAVDVIIVKARDSLWQKERLLNIGIDNVDDQYTKIAWLDCDILFTDYHWAKKTSDLLDQYPVVQPWDRVALLTAAGPEARVSMTYWSSFARIRHELPIDGRHGHTGFAWAARKDVLTRNHLYDAAIIGHADHLIGHAVHGDWASQCIDFHLPSQLFKEHFCEWGKLFFEDVQGQCISLLGEIKHLWHGELADRRYRSRHFPLKGYEFDPVTDLKINEYGTWDWASNKPDLHKMVNDYFKSRLEDGRTGGASVPRRTPRGFGHHLEQQIYPALPASPPGPAYGYGYTP